jgi:hypothetical protein
LLAKRPHRPLALSVLGGGPRAREPRARLRAPRVGTVTRGPRSVEPSAAALSPRPLRCDRPHAACRPIPARALTRAPQRRGPRAQARHPRLLLALRQSPGSVLGVQRTRTSGTCSGTCMQVSIMPPHVNVCRAHLRKAAPSLDDILGPITGIPGEPMVSGGQASAPHWPLHPVCRRGKGNARSCSSTPSAPS